MTPERPETPTPLLDALETLRMGSDTPDRDQAFVYLFEVIQAKKRRVLWSFDEAVREEACSRALAKLAHRRKPLLSKFEGAAHSYVQRTMWNEARSIVRPRPEPRPPKPPDQTEPDPPEAYDDVRASDEDVGWFFADILPKIVERYKLGPYAEYRKRLVSDETLQQSLDQLRRMALEGERPAIEDAAARDADRRRYQRAGVVLRIVLPDVWTDLGWCSPGLVWPTRSLVQLGNAIAEHEGGLQNQEIRRTFAVIVRLSVAFHVDTRAIRRRASDDHE